MEIQKYVYQIKEVYESLLGIIENDDENDLDSTYQLFYNQINFTQIKNDRHELGEFLKIISKISNNHCRHHNFISKIEQILLHFSEQIKQSFSNFEIFNYFKRNKLILLSLIEHKIITVDDTIAEAIFTESCIIKPKMSKTLLELIEIMDDDDNVEQNNEEENENPQYYYRMYFYPEIKSFLSEEQKKSIEEEMKNSDETIFQNFDEKRKKGENDSYICELIRNDSVELFIAYLNRTNCSLNYKIKSSIFESNMFLIKHEPTLIEYAAFFGSIQIFQYLKFNKVELKSSLWIYAIHSNNPELIHLLEENQIEPPDKSYSKVLKESIKCHHNNFAIYIKNNLMNESENIFFYKIDGNYYSNIYLNSFQQHNYYFISELINDKHVFFYLCEFNYITLVKLFLADKNIEINCKII